MTDLRKLARGRECLIRVPGFCSHDPEKVVGCHLRMAGITGISQKAPDLFMAYGCSPCHDVIDGRTRTHYSPDERRLMFFEGMVRTQQLLITERRLKW